VTLNIKTASLINIRAMGKTEE